MTQHSRQIIRQMYKRIRQNLPLNYQTQASQAICNHILSLAEFRQADTIALYHAINGEVDLTTLWLFALQENKTCYFPALNADKTLSFLPATPQTPLHKNRFGIAEPKVAQESAVQASELDIIFSPLIAFDKDGARLGMGAGYYDRTLAQKSPGLLAGVAYDFQQVKRIDSEPWDIPLSVVITEKTIYWSKS